jgi:hypothetical protein
MKTNTYTGGLIIRLSGVRVPVGPPIKSRGCSNSASSNSAILPQRLHRDYKTLLLTNLIGQGRPYLTPRGSYLVLRYCNCSCTDLRGAVLKKSEARQRADYAEARGKLSLFLCFSRYGFISSFIAIFAPTSIFRISSSSFILGLITIFPLSSKLIRCLSNRASYRGDRSIPLFTSSLSSSFDSLHGTI